MRTSARSTGLAEDSSELAIALGSTTTCLQSKS